MIGIRPVRRLTAGTLLLALVALVSATGLACGPRRQDTAAALVRTSDLPAGWTAVDVSDLDLDEIDEADLCELAQIMPGDLGLDPRGACAMTLTPLLRQIGANPPSLGLAVYMKSELGPFLVHTVMIVPPALADLVMGFLTNPAASQSFFESCQAELMTSGDGMLPPELGIPSDEDLGLSIQSTPLKLAPLGDFTVAHRTDITVGFIGTTLISVASTRGNAISIFFLLTDPISANTSTGMMEQLARTADARLQQALGGR